MMIVVAFPLNFYSTLTGNLLLQPGVTALLTLSSLSSHVAGPDEFRSFKLHFVVD